jgi:hypothetical protein
MHQPPQENAFSRVVPKSLETSGDKAGSAGRVEVMREVVYDMIRTLRVGVMCERQEFNSETHETTKTHLQSALLQVPQRFSNFQALREELEVSSVGEQLCRLRRRVALAKFYLKNSRNAPLTRCPTKP